MVSYLNKIKHESSLYFFSGIKLFKYYEALPEVINGVAYAVIHTTGSITIDLTGTTPEELIINNYPLYSPNTSRSVSAISPSVHFASTASITVGIRFSPEEA